jgi:L-gulonate 5-dehydrogenase
MVEEMALPLSLLYPLPPGADPACGPLVETLSIGCHACNRGRVASEDDVLVIGAGPIGLGVALIAKEKGARVGIVDVLASRLRLADELGIDFCIQGDGETESGIIGSFGCRPNVVIEAVGNPKTLELGLQVVSAAGRVVVVGWTAEPPKWRPDLFLRKELDLLGSRNSRGIFPQAIDFICRNQSNVKRLVTHRFKFDRIEEAMNLIDTAGSQTMKVIMEW